MSMWSVLASISPGPSVVVDRLRLRGLCENRRHSARVESGVRGGGGGPRACARTLADAHDTVWRYNSPMRKFRPQVGARADYIYWKVPPFRFD